MSESQYTILQGSRILVTGANGFIGSHIVDHLLAFGYKVRGTVRQPKPWLNELFDKKHGGGKFETVLLPNLNDAVDCDHMFDQVEGIIHVATDVSMSPDANKVITSSVQGTLAILEAAAKHPRIRRVVITSSQSAAYLPRADHPGLVTEETWNDAAIEAAWDQNTPAATKPVFVYAASKTEAERSAFKWVEDHGRPFVLNSVLPCMTVGKILAPEIKGSSQILIRKMLQGDDFPIKFLPPPRLHIAALLSPAITFDRIFAFATPTTWSEVVHVLHKLCPENTLIPRDPLGDMSEKRDSVEVRPAKRAKEILGDFWGREEWVGLEESIKDGIADLL
ncbi:Ketoreductase adrE [Penicillium oxalicum]|uniref:Ketoreductase adrE n=1 Tax=Penicillium oxalicum TaxID=69781 RepID=UPI0020B7E400|nr:Ketoreductase adrE [Penicillium oxalicum]KAI2790561.1 Ketoreductase adrE [Penicillium oxalicum]